MLMARCASPPFFFETKEKTKKKKADLLWGVAGLSRFSEKILPGFLVHSGQRQLAVRCIEDYKNGDGNEGGDFF